jgi:hypothetical protein
VATARMSTSNGVSRCAESVSCTTTSATKEPSVLLWVSMNRDTGAVNRARRFRGRTDVPEDHLDDTRRPRLRRLVPYPLMLVHHRTISDCHCHRDALMPPTPKLRGAPSLRRSANGTLGVGPCPHIPSRCDGVLLLSIRGIRSGRAVYRPEGAATRGGAVEHCPFREGAHVRHAGAGLVGRKRPDLIARVAPERRRHAGLWGEPAPGRHLRIRFGRITLPSLYVTPQVPM